MEFMFIYILTIFIIVLGVCLASLLVWLGMKGIGYVMSLWLRH